ncbi:MAG: V-type ATP synthase subunit I, partial [Magnetococcales bacterium]|nr:V-type ATP synthase subunit I [Magnetococcales bacterium]
MSIVPLTRVTLYGTEEQRHDVMAALQSLGSLHLIPLRPAAEEPERAPQAKAVDAAKALRHLSHVRPLPRQIRRRQGFDFDDVVTKTLENHHARHALRDEKEILLKQIQTRRPWGSFTLPDAKSLEGYRLWFYLVPHHLMENLEHLDAAWQRVHKGPRHAYVVVIAREKPDPERFPLPSLDLSGPSLSTMQQRLEEIELELESLVWQRQSLARWIALLKENLARAEDRAALKRADGLIRIEEGFFIVSG